jgi:hypothetical protein
LPPCPACLRGSWATASRTPRRLLRAPAGPIRSAGAARVPRRERRTRMRNMFPEHQLADRLTSAASAIPVAIIDATVLDVGLSDPRDDPADVPDGRQARRRRCIEDRQPRPRWPRCRRGEHSRAPAARHRDRDSGLPTPGLQVVHRAEVPLPRPTAHNAIWARREQNIGLTWHGCGTRGVGCAGSSVADYVTCAPSESG